MIRTQKRGEGYYIDFKSGTRRLRGSLGTKDKEVASRLRSRVEMALAEGAGSANWVELRHSLPAATYTRFAEARGVKTPQDSTWANLVSRFWTDIHGRRTLGKISANSCTRYKYAVEAFEKYLALKGIQLSGITPSVIDDYKLWRHAQILAKPNAKSGNGMAIEVSALRSVFQMAVDHQMIAMNPVRADFTRVEYEVNPFTGEELQRLRDACQTDQERLVYLLFRHTGMRISDVADLKWKHVHETEIVKRTIKRGKIVHVPMQAELLAALQGIRGNVEQSVINFNNIASTTAQLRGLVRLISSKADMGKVRCHRFRHTLACDLLLKGATPYEVGQVLGDTAVTVERHYLKFIRPLRARIKGLMDDNTKGLEA